MTKKHLIRFGIVAIFMGAFVGLAMVQTAVSQTADPCATYNKQTVPIAFPTATTGKILAGTLNEAIVVCGGPVTAAGTAPAIQFFVGTGATPTASATNEMTGVMGGTSFVGQLFAQAGTNSTQFTVPQATASPTNDLWATTTGGPIAGSLQYVKIPQ